MQKAPAKKLKTRAELAILCLLVSTSVSAESGKRLLANTTQVAQPLPASVSSSTPSWMSKISGELSIGHYLTNGINDGDRTELAAGLTYKLDDKHSLSALQGASKLYSIPVGDSEFLWTDFRLRHSYLIPWKPQGIRFRLSESLSFPTSRAAQRSSMIVAPAVALKINRKFFADQVTASYVPSFKYYFNKYSNTIDGTQNRRMLFNNHFALSYKVFKKLTLDGTFEIVRYIAEPSTYTQVRLASEGERQLFDRWAYTFGLSASYEIHPNISPRLGVEQGDAMTKEGRVEMNIYDPVNTRYIVALDLSF